VRYYTQWTSSCFQVQITRPCVHPGIQRPITTKWSTKQWEQAQREFTNWLKMTSLRSLYVKELCCTDSVYQGPMERRPSLFLNSPPRSPSYSIVFHRIPSYSIVETTHQPILITRNSRRLRLPPLKVWPAKGQTLDLQTLDLQVKPKPQ